MKKGRKEEEEIGGKIKRKGETRGERRMGKRICGDKEEKLEGKEQGDGKGEGEDIKGKGEGEGEGEVR